MAYYSETRLTGDLRHAKLVCDANAPVQYAVWLGEDIVGAGETSDQAIADARAQLTQWTNYEVDRAIQLGQVCR